VSGARWLKLDLPVEIEPPLEVRAEPDGRGGWRIRAERSQAEAGTTLFGWLQASPQGYHVRLGGERYTRMGDGTGTVDA
jgi:hypothetical protein